MQVERSPQGESGKRVRNTWVTYPEVWDTPTKDGLIPHVIFVSHEAKKKGGLDRKVAVASGGACVPSASW